ncbi:unnamed protein product [Urochloa humidicola]
MFMPISLFYFGASFRHNLQVLAGGSVGLILELTAGLNAHIDAMDSVLYVHNMSLVLLKSKFRDGVLLWVMYRCQGGKDIAMKTHPMNLLTKENSERNSVGSTNQAPMSSVLDLYVMESYVSCSYFHSENSKEERLQGSVEGPCSPRKLPYAPPLYI